MLEKYRKRKKNEKEKRTVAGVEVVSNVSEFIGNMPLLIPIMDKLGIKDIVDHFCPMERDNLEGLSHGEVVEMLIYNRLTSPSPLYRVDGWASLYALDTIFGIKPDKLNDDRIARALEAVNDKMEEIQSAISLKMMQTFGISAEIVHYDITSLSFEGAYEESEIVKFGYSRDKRPDLKQINLSLDVTRDGAIPIWSEILAGNTTDVKTVIDNMNNLKKNITMKDYLTIMDRGMVSADNLSSLDKENVGFVAAVPTSKRVLELVVSMPAESCHLVAYTDRNEKDQIKAAKCELEFHTKEDKKNGKKSETITFNGFIFESSEKKKRDIKTRAKGIAEIADIFEDISKKLNTRKYANRDYVRDQIKKQIGKKKAANLFWWDVCGDDKALSLDYCLDNEVLSQTEAMDGKYVLATNLDRWTADEVISAYKCQHLVEWRFRHMKSHLKVSPIFLQKDERISGLVFVTVAALMVYSLLEYLCKKAKVPYTSFMLMVHFGFCFISRLRFSNDEILVMSNDLTKFQSQVLDSLKFPHPREYL